MRLGEGSGAGLAIGVVRAAVACHNDMATFETAGEAPAAPVIAEMAQTPVRPWRVERQRASTATAG